MADSARQRYLSILGLEPTELTLRWEFGFWGATLLDWYRQGLPKMVGFERDLIYGEFVNGPGLQYPMPSYDDNVQYAHDIVRQFDLDPGPSPFPFNWYYCPRWEPRRGFPKPSETR